jgi:hypothetical protein
MAAPDRKTALLAQNLVTGIDFVAVDASQTKVDVYFLNDPLGLTLPLTNLAADQVMIYDAQQELPTQEIGIATISWIVVGTDNVLRVQTTTPGDYRRFKFSLMDPRVDRYFNHLDLNFKANCPSDLDCKQPPLECAPFDWVDFPVDYTARDFDSYRLALTDFAAQRYPKWTDRLEADAGIMYMEVLSALGDEMAYYQDHIAREMHFETATERRSVRRHARLLDYPMHDGLGASTWIDVTVKQGFAHADLVAGMDVWAVNDNHQRILFEVGDGHQSILDSVVYRVVYNNNQFQPHSWDENDVCLPAGATEIYVEGHHHDDLRPSGGVDVEWIVLQTAEGPGRPAKVHLVRLDEVVDDDDPILGVPVTRLVWSAAYATPFQMDMEILAVRANIVPVVAGASYTERFIVGEDPDPFALSQQNYGPLTRALERVGPGGVPIYLFSLQGSDVNELVWEGQTAVSAYPALTIEPVSYVGTNWVPTLSPGWTWRPSLLGSPSSQPTDPDFVLDDGLWRRVVGYRTPTGMLIHQDYASGKGKTIRFGDGEFGQIPTEGTIFQTHYRLGNGTVANVKAGTITQWETQDALNNPIASIHNPFAALNGEEAESIATVKQLAPEAMRAVTYRAVRPEDYAEAAERLPWVQKAGANFRWTGSWLTGFVAPDPLGKVSVSDAEFVELGLQMDRFRMAGREVYTVPPRYANIDLEVTICIEAGHLAQLVKAKVLEALFGKGGPRPIKGYFHPDRFTFGTPLHRSSLEAHIQMVPGVLAVDALRLRRRGWFDWETMTDDEYSPGIDTIIRVSNDPFHPEHGTCKIYIHGTV